MSDDPTPAIRALLERTYTAFNARDINTTLAAMRVDVEWPNGMEGGYVNGHDAVRAYWLRQWTTVDPHVQPIRFSTDDEGWIVLDVQQVVRDLTGAVLVDRIVQHAYRFADGLVTRMEIREVG